MVQDSLYKKKSDEIEVNLSKEWSNQLKYRHSTTDCSPSATCEKGLVNLGKSYGSRGHSYGVGCTIFTPSLFRNCCRTPVQQIKCPTIGSAQGLNTITKETSGNYSSTKKPGCWSQFTCSYPNTLINDSKTANSLLNYYENGKKGRTDLSTISANDLNYSMGLWCVKPIENKECSGKEKCSRINLDNDEGHVCKYWSTLDDKTIVGFKAAKAKYLNGGAPPSEEGGGSGGGNKPSGGGGSSGSGGGGSGSNEVNIILIGAGITVILLILISVAVYYS